MLSIAAVVITCFGLAVLTRGSTDEHDGRTEQVLATATSRSRSLVASLLVALGGAAWLLLVTGLATGVGLGRDVGGLVEAGLAQLPAVWLVVSLAALLLRRPQQLVGRSAGACSRCSSRSASSATC